MTSLLTDAVIFSAVVIFIYMNLWFIISLILDRNDVADFAWGLGFVVVIWALFYKNTVVGIKNQLNFTILAVLTTIWGLRLAAHIYSRNKNKDEDYRYKKWREDWGKWFYIRSYFQVFIFQGVLMLLISSTAIISSVYNGSIGLISSIGMLIWLVGFYFEVVGDYQLSRFINKPENKGKIMTEGLWKYTRHPNYFGEVTLWWGIFLIGLITPYNFLAIISPLTITILILKVSGIPMLEERYEDDPEFQKYKKVTSKFFPWFPKEKGV